MDHIDVVIVGAGVVGLALAREVALSGKSVLIIEKQSSFGMATSSRNSEVIHAGIYYPQDSLKARYCIEGNRRLYAFAKERDIAYKNYGKLIVACHSNELDALEKIWLGAKANGVSALERLSQSQVRAKEPELNAVEAIYSGTTGIIDSHSFMLTLLGDFENAGGMISFRTTLNHAHSSKQQGRWIVSINSLDDPDVPFDISCDYLINAAGLGAVDVAHRLEGHSVQQLPEAYFVKGNYFSLSGKTPFTHLIYPVPEQAGLGVHLTLDLNGRAKFGPDVEHIETRTEEEIDYAVNPLRQAHFEKQIRQYWPSMPSGVLSPDYSGVRPKIQYAGQVYPDFRVDTEKEHGLGGLIHYFGFESPGLTASLAIAADLRQLIK